MIIKNVVDAMPSLHKIINQDVSLRCAYAIHTLIGTLEPTIKFYEDGRTKFLSEFCDIKGDRYIPKSGKSESLESAMNELLTLEVSAKIEPIILSCDEPIKLSGNDIALLQGFITFKE